MPSGVPKLVVWPLSGVPVGQKAFQQMLHDYWRHHGEAKQHQLMNFSSNGGIALMNSYRSAILSVQEKLMVKWLKNTL